MSHTVSKAAGALNMTDRYQTYTRLSALTAGTNENVLHGGHSGTEPEDVRMQVVTPATDGSPIIVSYTRSNNSTSNDTAGLQFDVPTGGSITGAVVDLYFTFNVGASGGIS